MGDVEALAEDHAPVLGVFAGKAGVVGCSCMDARQWRSYLNARTDRSQAAWRAHASEQLAAHVAAARAEALREAADAFVADCDATCDHGCQEGARFLRERATREDLRPREGA